MSTNILIVHDCEYQINQFYKNGAMACRFGSSYHSNPHHVSSQRHSNWNRGYENEENGEHQRQGLDVIAERNSGKVFSDKGVCRDEDGVVINM